MKILIITSNVGRTAPGIVFERLIDGFSKIHDVEVLTSDFDPSLKLQSVRKTLIVDKLTTHPRINKLLISILKKSPFDILWRIKAIKEARSNQMTTYDIVFPLISFHSYSALYTGVYMCKNSKSKLAVYSVDAIPAPIGWSKNDEYYKGTKKMISRLLSKTDFLFSANEQMLKYQLSLFQHKTNLKSSVLFNPNSGKIKKLPVQEESENVFLYTGAIYQARKPENVLKAFEKLLFSYPDSKLIFVGTQLLDETLLNLNETTKKAIQILPFRKNLESLYQMATALIDIDADLLDDVYLSSKIINYLELNRIIISETGKNSPSRKLFKEIKSIIICNHDEIELCEAMIYSIKNCDNISFDDRLNVLENFSIDDTVQKITRIIN